MSGETENRPSGWTVDTLKHHFDDLRTDDQRAVNAALASAEKANDKSEAAQRAVNVTQNEFRQTLKDQASTLMPIKEAEAKFDALQKQVTTIADTQKISGGKSSGLRDGWAYLVAVIGMILAAVGLILAFRH